MLEHTSATYFIFPYSLALATLAFIYLGRKKRNRQPSYLATVAVVFLLLSPFIHELRERVDIVSARWTRPGEAFIGLAIIFIALAIYQSSSSLQKMLPLKWLNLTTITSFIVGLFALYLIFKLWLISY